MLTVASGARFLFGVVLKPMSEQFGGDRAALTGAVMVGMIVLSICQPAVGLLVDRIGPKRMVVAGCALIGFSLIPLSRATQLWQVYLVYGVLFSVGLAAASPVNAAALVSRWFHAKRGAAMSIATSGSAFGQLIIVPIAAWILTLTSWQTTYRLVAIALLVGMVPLGLLFLRDGPGPKQETAERVAAGEGVTLGRAIRTFDFWCLAFGFVVCGWTMAFPNVHFLAWADDMGMPAVHAADIVAVTALFSIVGSLSLGVAADRHRRAAILALVYFLRGMAFLLLVVLPTGNLIFLYALVLGISWTATTPLTAAIAADRFGAKHIGLIFGSLYTFMNLGSGLGSFIDGLIYEREHAYVVALIANVVFGVLGAIGAFRIGDGPLPELREPAAARRDREPAAALGAPAD
ncbi:MAG TPA: MFS transporter [Thermomicrobiales bacterium]|jgi:MFS family permease|nr:MFS transporter [Thermomicrobiales bacterium]